MEEPVLDGDGGSAREGLNNSGKVEKAEASTRDEEVGEEPACSIGGAAAVVGGSWSTTVTSARNVPSTTECRCRELLVCCPSFVR